MLAEDLGKATATTPVNAHSDSFRSPARVWRSCQARVDCFALMIADALVPQAAMLQSILAGLPIMQTDYLGRRVDQHEAETASIPVERFRTFGWAESGGSSNHSPHESKKLRPPNSIPAKPRPGHGRVLERPKQVAITCLAAFEQKLRFFSDVGGVVQFRVVGAARLP